jgi:hypothetical protein
MFSQRQRTSPKKAALLAGCFCSLLALLCAPAAFAQSTNFNSAATGGASDRQALFTNEAMAAKPPKSEAKAEAKPATPEAAEMAKTITLLEERLRLLEEKLAKMNEAAAKTNTPVPPQQIAEVKKEVVALQEEAKKNESTLSFFRNVELSGVIDAYYLYNGNKPDPGVGTTGRAFDVSHNNFSLNLAKFTLEKKNDTQRRLGFRLDLAFGPTAERIQSANDRLRVIDGVGFDATKHLLQAYLSYVAPVGKGLTIDFGKFVTPVGAEVIETKDNFNYSRSFLFTYGPYYHTGLRAKYAVNDKVAVTGFVLNGWDKLFDNNTGKTVGFSVGLTPTKRFALTQTYLGGPENDLTNKGWRNISDTVATVIVNDKVTLLGNFAYTKDRRYVNNVLTEGNWKGFAGYARFAITEKIAFSPRFEIFDDPQGFQTGVAQTLKGITLTQEFKLSNNLLSRLEFRRDMSDQSFFARSGARTAKDQNTFIIGLSYFFTSRE